MGGHEALDGGSCTWGDSLARLPKAVSHYTANWVPREEFESFQVPTWPLKDDAGQIWDRNRLRKVGLSPMEWLNYHHLFYFWTVARLGTVSRAGKELRLAQPTISGQLRALENALDEKLFRRAGRQLVLTEVGRVVFRYCEEIFSLGRELQDTLKGRPTGRPLRFRVGVSDHLPKLVVVRLLEPALKLPEPVQLICLEDKPERLLAELSVHGLDLVLNDAPVSPSAHVKAFNHLLGACPIAFFAIPPLAKLLRRGFPRSLDGNPLLLPVGGSVLRRELEMWLETEQVRPLIRGEFQDSALMKIFGQRGLGVFIGPAAIEKEICRQYGVSVIGKTEKLREQFYAISIERKVRHPAVVAITETARQLLCQ